MSAESVFTITYWGVTGSLCAPLRPPEVTDKLVRAVEELVVRGKLADLRPGPGLHEAILAEVQKLPFPLRSTYGGNTTCVEVRTPDSLIILDCGSGLRELGIALDQRWNAAGYDGARSAHVLITHPHMDHTFGIPYTSPYFDPGNHFSLSASRSRCRSSMRNSIVFSMSRTALSTNCCL